MVPKSLQAETYYVRSTMVIKALPDVEQRLLSSVASVQMEEFVKVCPVCVKMTTPPKKPLLQTPLPNHPYLFDYHGSTGCILLL